ncbi:MAG TPA: Clp protease N-terminal domain-containing protein [Propionibacteriaceae bacterium]|jgi:ATP-dependent Clp protease ATP-binding subunit ClpA|nr:Clp protease N-terminal domain-containing protein [Propionibacteriaceae bacterium]
MFERFTHAARQVIVRGQEEARTFRHPWLGTEHLLLGILAQPGAPGVRVLTDLGVNLDTGRATLSQLVGRGGLSSPGSGESDADALRTLGIDLDEVRRRAESSFGPRALDYPPGRPPRRRLLWRRGRCGYPDLTGHLPFMPRAKRALERAHREAAALGDQHIGVEHLLLGLLDPKSNMAVELLRHLGADPEVLRTRLLADLGKAA